MMSRRTKRKYEENENTDRWLVSYADFITLLFAFFVVMYSISSVNEGKYRVLSDSISSAFEQSQEGLSVQLNSPLKPPIIEHDILLDRQQAVTINNNYSNTWPKSNNNARLELIEISKQIEKNLSSLINKNLVNVKKNDFSLDVEIMSSVLFPSGSSTLSTESRPILNELSRVLGQYKNQIRVEGFTDNVPIKTDLFPSNWELSASRAASVVHLLSREGIDPERLSATGYGEFKPVASNDTAAGRSKNRRISIIVLSDLLTKKSKK